MLKNKLFRPVDGAEDQAEAHPVDTRDNDQLLSAATELCLIYLECEKIIRKHERVLGTYAD